MRAVNMIRTAPEYRRAAFDSGLAAAGYTLANDVRDPRPGDLLVIWNRYGRFHQEAMRFEAAGASVVVVENGYYDPRRTGWHDRHVYAMALNGHNGSGRWPGNGVEYPDGYDDVEDRLMDFDVDFEAWGRSDGYILVCGQRGIGSPIMASPPDWEADVARRLRAFTDRTIKIRRHPGNRDPEVPIERDLEGAWACVVWSSNCSIAALRRGVPVFYEAPAVVTHKACHRTIDMIERRQPEWRGTDRFAAFLDLVWAQYSVEEIASGWPFKVLLGEGAARAAA
jgi:hypothetical protein